MKHWLFALVFSMLCIGTASALGDLQMVTVPPNEKIDSLIAEYTDVRKWFIKAHSEFELDSINSVIQDMRSIPWIEKLRGRKYASRILLKMKQKAASETAIYKQEIESQKQLFLQRNPGLYDENARDVMFYDFGKKFVFLPMGRASFADVVTDYVIGDPAPSGLIYTDPENAISPPGEKYARANGFGVTSLGCGGSLVLEFTDNALVDINGPDLYIFESFAIMEPTYLSISKDGFRWVDIGIVEGGKTEVDIHDFVEQGDVFHFVQLTDNGMDARSPAGADIDAVAAIGSALRATFEVTVLFDHDRFIPRPGVDAALKELAASIRKYANARISITGHTDDVGDEAYNKELSRKRVASIVERLQGLLPDSDYSWTSACFGETRPVAENVSAEGRARNRRVEVVVRWLR